MVPLWGAEPRRVRLQLRWQHQFQYAGYYAAQAQGYYQAAGLEVEILPSQTTEDPVQQVVQGKADFGVGSTDLLLLRQQGVPVVALAVIFQHSPLALLTRKESGLQTIHDLAGRKIMLEPGSSELLAYLRKVGIPSEKFTQLPHGFHPKDLLTGTVDAMSAYVTDEPFELESAGQEYVLHSPRSVGIDFYGENLFTTERQLEKNPEMVKAFRAASLRGWEYAMQHPEELVQLIYSRYTQRHSLEHLRFEARQMVPLLQANLVEIGHMNPGRWRHIADTYAELGMINADFDFKGFLFDPNPPPRNLGWLYRFFGLAIVLIGAVLALVVYIYRINVRLRREIAERRQAIEALGASEEKHRILFQDSPDAFLILVDGIFVECNRAAEIMLRGERAQIIGKSPGLISPEFQPDGRNSLQAVEERITEALRLKTNTFDWVHRRLDGSEFLVEVSIASMVFEGKPALFTAWRDLTDRKLAETALRISEEKYRSLTESMKDVVWTLDAQTLRFVFVSPSVYELRGFTPEEVIAEPFDAALTPEAAAQLRAMVVQDIERFRASNYTLDLSRIDELEQPRKDGTTVWTEVITKYRLNKATGAVEIQGVTRDITMRKQALEVLRRNEAKFRCLFELSPIGLAMVSHATGAFLEVNDALLRQTGYTKEEFLQLQFWAITPSEYEAQEHQQLRDLNEHGFFGPNEKEYIRKDGSRYPIRISGAISINDAGEKVVWGVIEDITESKQAEADKARLETQNYQLQKAESLGLMAGSIAHHFNNKLQAVIGNLELVGALPKDANPARFIAMAKQGAEKAAEVSRMMLTYLGQTSLKREPCWLTECCQTTLPLIQNTLPSTVALETEFPSPGPMVSANAEQIQQLLTNLLTNAGEALGEAPGTVRLSLRTCLASDIAIAHRFPYGWESDQKDYACLEVTDTGCGIAKADFEKLFDPFFSTKFIGRGLGLSVVLGIVQAHRAAITVASQLGQGSVFRVYFPVVAKVVSNLPEPTVSVLKPEIAATGGTLLLVDDDPLLLDSIRDLIEVLGFKVLTACDGVAALETFCQHQGEIRLVITDLTMPRLDGWGTLKALRQLDPKLPVILASGYDKAQVLAGTQPDRPQAFLSKPFGFRQLRDALGQALGSAD
ncbi:MAG: ABC transporter substrate-binding protein [Holophaga sp.]|nr:ABC transporter substrate-binding protein [Holophaga sp.]